MFALTYDREPLVLNWTTFLASLNTWAQVVGGFAMVGLVLWLVAQVLTRGSPQAANAIGRTGSAVLLIVLFGPLGALLVYWLVWRRKGQMPLEDAASLRVGSGAERGPLLTVLFIGAFVWAAFGYLLLLALYLPDLIHAVSGEGVEPAAGKDNWRPLAQSLLWTAAGASAIFAVLLPLLADLGRLSPRRIWAIARLSFKEAIRRKVLWVFLALLLVVLFGSWFIPHKPEDQVRDYVTVVFTAMSLIMLFLAGLIAAFGIPDDIRHQTIHTVLTKPVQRFEIFLGRFLGYVLLLTAALAAVSAIGLLYVLRNIEPEAAEESLKARQPFYGKLSYVGTRDKEKGENVGREWQYRGYISGRSRTGTDPTQFAVWSFQDLPAALANRDKNRMEFTLDIYRTHKGVEGQGVFATFFIESWRFDPDNPALMEKYRTRKKELEDHGEPDVAGTLARELGYYEYPSMEIKDFHTQYIEVPSGVIQNALEPDKAREEELRRRREWPVAPLRVRVRCDSPAQFLGMAPYDLYFRLDSEDPTGTVNKLRFCANFFKGSFGLWLRLCLLLGLAVALSTYLSGVITLLSAGSLFVLGFFHTFIIEVATRKNIGGGPVESAMRLLKRPGGEPIAGQLEESASTQVATGLDTAFSWSLSLIKNVIPDVGLYNFTDFVAEGVAISSGQMIMALLLLAGYVLPCAVLAYYLLKWREVASSN